MGKRMLVTGGAGFLGSQIAARAAADGFEVVVVDDLSRGVATDGPSEFVEADVNDSRQVGQLPGADVIVHCAALCGVPSCLAEPERVLADYAGTGNLCDHATECGAERFVFLSSGEIYGSDALDAREQDAIRIWNVHEPRAFYALSKLMGEARVRMLRIANVTIRPFNVYGPGQRGCGVVNNFVEWALRGEPLQVHNGGGEVRAMCHVDDFVRGCYAAIIADRVSPVYNIGNPSEAMTVNEIAAKVIAATGSQSTVVHVETDYAAKRGVTPNVERAARELGFEPSISLEEGLERMLATANGQVLPVGDRSGSGR